MSIFSTFLKLHYSGLKSILSYPEYQKTIFSGLIFPKNTHEKIFNFWIKSIIYLENFDFSDFSKTSLLMSKQHSYLRLFLLNLPNKYLWENIRFFHKNHELTPLENFDFLGYFKTSHFWSKHILFYPEYQKKIFSGLVCHKNTHGKKFAFLTQSMVRFFRLFKNIFFLV